MKYPKTIMVIIPYFLLGSLYADFASRDRHYHQKICTCERVSGFFTRGIVNMELVVKSKGYISDPNKKTLDYLNTGLNKLNKRIGWLMNSYKLIFKRKFDLLKCYEKPYASSFSEGDIVDCNKIMSESKSI